MLWLIYNKRWESHLSLFTLQQGHYTLFQIGEVFVENLSTIDVGFQTVIVGAGANGRLRF